MPGSESKEPPQDLRGEWSLEEAGGVTLIRCRALDAVPGVAHAFSTRRGAGGSDLDMGDAGCEEPAVLQARAALLAAARLAGWGVAVLEQVHGDRIVTVEEARSPVKADGILLAAGTMADRAAGIRTADCVPVLVADGDGRWAAAVHAGWRGTAAGIATGAVERLASLGAAPGRMIAALGPAVGPCCYRVGGEVLRAVANSCRCDGSELLREGSGGSGLDLRRANRLQLERAGIPAGAVFEAPWCTSCREDLFFSYRRQGAAAGRMMAVLGLP